ncbi:hypothetical protein [Nitratireductor basaltis]|uniref:Uncharacterized protein n=1 Tax=Nitratireductor basaltis TaxID=472175 RepID=A0A084UDK2_9HYPH|nr:hypothetical protein [Nitratireductor basaltis]KFB11038.1 hypothetical protein EL18_02080 [Nitratireductor basaltis]
MELERISALVSVVVCGALYSAGIFTAGLVYGAPMAVAFSIATVACGYIGSTLSTFALSGRAVKPAFIAFFLYGGFAFGAASAIALAMGV